MLRSKQSLVLKNRKKGIMGTHFSLICAFCVCGGGVSATVLGHLQGLLAAQAEVAAGCRVRGLLWAAGVAPGGCWTWGR